MADDILLKTIRRFIDEGNQVLRTEFDAGERGFSYVGGRPRGVELTPFAKWQAGCMNLLRMLGTAGVQWEDTFSRKKNSPGVAKRMLGTLQAIEDAVEHGLLVRVEDLVRAEAFDGLLEQAEYLQSEGYFLAAGVGVSLTIQALVNVAVATGTIPPTGLTLPFVSAGGSSLISCLIAVGLVLAVARDNQRRAGRG